MSVEKLIERKLLRRKHLLFVLLDAEVPVNLEDTIRRLKEITSIPVILFPGNITGISQKADAILFSSLLNSDDPYFIIGIQALAAPMIRRFNLEAIPMGYIIIGTGQAAGFVGRARSFPE